MFVVCCLIVDCGLLVVRCWQCSAHAMALQLPHLVMSRQPMLLQWPITQTPGADRSTHTLRPQRSSACGAPQPDTERTMSGSFERHWQHRGQSSQWRPSPSGPMADSHERQGHHAKERRHTYAEYTFLGGHHRRSLPHIERCKLVNAMLGDAVTVLTLNALRGAQPLHPHRGCSFGNACQT